MVAALPGNIRLKLEQTLAQWRQWHCEPALTIAPSIVSVLTSGLSNHSVLVKSDRCFVVRIDGINPAAHRLNRQGEWRNLVLAQGAGLAPAPRYFNPDLGSLVCDYLSPDENQSPRMADTARLLRDIHQLPARHQRLDLAERILNYEKRIAHRNPNRAAPLEPYQQKVAEVLANSDSSKYPLVLCHHDLLRANRLYSGGKLFALDWEYSAMGSAWYDLAVVAAGDELTPAEVTSLLTTYLGTAPDAAERQLVMQYACVYRYLELLWYLAQDHPGLDDDQLAQRVASLGEHLHQLEA